MEIDVDSIKTEFRESGRLFVARMSCLGEPISLKSGKRGWFHVSFMFLLKSIGDVVGVCGFIVPLRKPDRRTGFQDRKLDKANTP